MAASNIHPTAILSKETQVDPTASVGPYSITYGRVKIGPRTRVSNHVTIGSEFGEVEIGSDNQILAGAVIGSPPQDLSYKNQLVKVKIGDKNLIREFVTINLGTEKGGGLTTVGNSCMLMAYTHVAHDCQISDRVIVANETQFAGHVIVESDVRLGGGCLINQFVKIGRFAYIAGDATINKDVLPFAMTQGKYAVARATNKIGLERAGFSKERVENIHRALRVLIMGAKTIDESLATIKTECDENDDILYLVDFVKSSSRGIARE